MQVCRAVAFDQHWDVGARLCHAVDRSRQPKIHIARPKRLASNVHSHATARQEAADQTRAIKEECKERGGDPVCPKLLQLQLTIARNPIPHPDFVLHNGKLDQIALQPKSSFHSCHSKL